jgi:two-component system, response regulator, stage 0 sporulation protein F
LKGVGILFAIDLRRLNFIQKRRGGKEAKNLFSRNSMNNISKRILVVDDDQGILDSFEVLLGDRYDLIKAENGYEALRILEADPPQLMFLDIKMPGLNGIDILKKLQGNKKHVEVVVITASGQEGIEEEAKSLGVVDYLKKPLDIFEVERITSHVLQ